MAQVVSQVMASRWPSGLKEIDIGPRDKPRPMCVSAKLDPEYMPELIYLTNEI